MTDKILEITEKIYNEGVVKAEVDAEKIINDAKKEAEKIIADAKNQKLEIIANANRISEEIKKNTNSEIQLAARQFISTLKKQITTTITTAQIQQPVKQTFSDIEFVKNVIKTIIQNWSPHNQENMDLKVLLPEKNEKDFSEFLDKKAIEIMNKGLEVKYDSNTRNGFKIGPKDGSYIISFSEKDFENYFIGYFKERTRKLLFDDSLAKPD